MAPIETAEVVVGVSMNLVMECPSCGSTQIGYREMMGFTGYQCQNCGSKWMEMGPPRFVREMQRASEEWFAAVKVYGIHGTIVWLIPSVVYFFACVQQPFATLIALSAKTWGSLAFIVLLTGFFLGQSLLGALDLTGKWCPGWKAAHIIGPLSAAASVGSLFGLVLVGVSIQTFQDELQLRNPILCMVVGAALAMLATPVIIVRSGARLKRLGFRRETRQRKDERWDS